MGSNYGNSKIWQQYNDRVDVIWKIISIPPLKKTILGSSSEEIL